nr:unnamed protein product [Callosobruchus analis]
MEQSHKEQDNMFLHMSSHNNLNKRTLNISGAYNHHEGVNHRQSAQEEQRSCLSNFGGIPMQEQNNADVSRSLDETTSLEKLLQTWGLEDLKSYFIQQKITVSVLKIIRMHHIQKLFKDMPVGTQVIFEHHLKNWRKAIGSPLDNTLQNDGDVLNATQKPCLPAPSTQSTPASSCHPYLHPEERADAGAKIHLADILNTVKGRMLCTFYEANQRFEEEQRNALVNLISQYFDEKQIPMSLATSYKIEKEIIGRFKNEKLVS